MKNAIALLTTLVFIMFITISIGIGLKQLNQASSYVENEKFLYQSSVILRDTLNVLNNLQELQDINSSQDLSDFLISNSTIPFQIQGIKITMELSSARSKFNINCLTDADKKPITNIVDSFNLYLSNYMIDTSYVNILLDSMGGIKSDLSYNSDLFSEKTNIFRDYITSYKHLKELNDFYTLHYNDDSLKNIDFKNLFYYSKDRDYKIDLSFATARTWELMLGCDEQRAIDLSSEVYESLEDIGLSVEEKNILTRFKSSIFEKFLYVNLNILQENQSANISFEYDIENKKGSNFVYKI